MRYLVIFLILLLLVVSLFAQDTTEILMDSNKLVTAHFKKIQYTLTTAVEPVGSGTISGAGTYDVETTVTIEAIPALGYVFDHWSFGKWSGLGMMICQTGTDVEYDGWIDTLLANGFTEFRETPSYQNVDWLESSKYAVWRAIQKGAKFVWGVSSDITTAENWETFRQAILDNAQWAQDNGVYEFQIGNEEEWHVDGTTMTVAQIITNLKSVATEAQEIFTNGKVSYSCLHPYIDSWIASGKGDIDILASNVYRGDTTFNDEWKSKITNLVNAFGVDGTYLTEFNLSCSDINNYSTDEAVQAEAITEMIDYIKASGMTRAVYFIWYHPGFDMGVIKDDGTYRELWKSLINSN